MRRDILLLFFGTFILLGMMSLAIAAGVSAEYWNKGDAKPMTLSPGESKIATFTLQNMVGEEDLSFQAQIINGSEIASLVTPDAIYSVPHGTKDVPVAVRVTAPAGAHLGERYNVGVSFTTIAAQESGQFRMGSAFDLYFDVVIVDAPQLAPVEPAGAVSWKIYGIIIAVVVIVVLIVLLIIRKRGPRTKN